MATILRISKLFYSIRWQFVLLFLALVALVFGMVAMAVSSLVEDHLVKQRIDTQKKNTSNIALQISPYLAEADSNSMYDVLLKNSKELEGRFLVLNSSGIVQADSASSEYNGRRIKENEIDEILLNQKDSAEAFHKVNNASGEESFWALYTTSSIMNNGKTIGVLLYSSSIKDVMRATSNLRIQLLWMYIFACVLVVVASVFFTGVMTKPVKQLTEVAMKISSGDLSKRSSIKGKSEMSELGETFNMMCDKLQVIDEQRSQFVSDASHELKTPLASMKILVESLLYQENVPEEVYKEFLGDINNEIDRLSNLITDLLLLSKMDNNIQVIDVEKVQLAILVEKCYQALSPIAKHNKISLNLHIESQGEVEGDPLKLRQAINNLMENALKYTQEGGQVDVTVKKESGNVLVIVKDNGMGISEKHLIHIFERFYRVDKARSRDTGGTGLGLHIVRRIALMHGGRVLVESKEGQGSQFTLVIPVSSQQIHDALVKNDETPEGKN